MKKLRILTALLILTISINFIFFSELNANQKRETKLSQIVENGKWVKLENSASNIYLEFLERQKEAVIETELSKNPIKVELNTEIDENEKDTDLKNHFSNLIELDEEIQWLKVESNGKVRVHGFGGSEGRETVESGLGEFSEMVKNNFLFASTKNLLAKATGIRIIPRSSWGADESLRYNYGDGASVKKTAYNVSVGGACNGKGKSETSYAKIIYGENGNPLLWPYQYSSKVKKIVVHHTAEYYKSYNIPGDKKIRAIYKYHTLTRGWGDIGYHYVIDQKGNIYEGKAGGDYVVGAHVKCSNIGTVSISLMGNFQSQNPTLAQLRSLSALTAKLGAKYSIDVSGKSSYHGQFSNNLLGHRDLGATACPGDNLYGKLGSIAKQIELSDFNFEVSKTRESRNGTKIAEIQTDVNVIEIKPTSKKLVVFPYKNNGTETWTKGTWLYVKDNTSKNLNVTSIFADKNYVAANLREDKVYPGEIGHFNVEVNSGYKSGLYSLEFVPIINGTTKFTKGTVVQPFKVTEAKNSYQFTQLTKRPPAEVFAGQSLTAKIKLKNTGNTNWFRSGENAITLKTYQLGRHSPFVAKEDGYNPTILARMVEPTTPPGEIGTFEFLLRAPLDHGNYEEKFIPIIGETTLLGDRTMQFNIKVKRPNYRAQLIRESRQTEFLTGQKKTVRLGLKNLSDVYWEEDQVEFRVVKSGALKFNSNSYAIGEFVPRHQAGFANVTIQAPKKPGTYTAILQALANGKKFNRLGRFELKITVKGANLSADLTHQSDKTLHLPKGKTGVVTIRIKNKTNLVWYKNGSNKISVRTLDKNSPLQSNKWISSAIVASMKESKVLPGKTATFEIPVKANKSGSFTESFFARINSVGTLNGSEFQITVVSGESLKSNSPSTNNTVQKNNKTENFNSFLKSLEGLSLAEKIKALRERKLSSGVKGNEAEGSVKTNSTEITGTDSSTRPTRSEGQRTSYTTNLLENPSNEIKVKLSFPHNALNVDFKGSGKIYLDKKQLNYKSGDTVWTRADGNKKIIVSINGQKNWGKTFFAKADSGSFVRLRNWNHSPAWNPGINDNFYRGGIEVRSIDSQVKGKIDVVNKLQIEDYMKGIAEVPESSSNEKRKALAVISRSYAAYYTKTKWRKFPGKLYDASDNPNVFQKYLGAGYELRSPLWQRALQETKGEVLEFNGEILKAAYFSCSNGKTKTPVQAGWKSSYFDQVAVVYQSVDDSYGKDLIRYRKGQCGHGVGLSGLGAENLAQRGWSYKKILYYYYQDVNIRKSL